MIPAAPERAERTFTLMLALALLLSAALAALVAVDLRQGRSAATSTGAGTSGGLAGGPDLPATPDPNAPLATPGAGGTPVQRAGGAVAAAGIQAAHGGGAVAPGTLPTGACGDCYAAGATIPLGAIVTQTGPGRSLTLAHALVAWERDVDRRGGIAGHQVSLDLRDDAGNPDTGASQYRSLGEDEKVLALTGECAPITDAQQVDYLARVHLPDIGECQSADSAYSSPWVFIAGPTPFQNGKLAATLTTQTQGWSRSHGSIALVCLDEAAVASTCRGAEAVYGDDALWSGHPQLEQIADSNYAQLISQWRADGVRAVHLVLEPGNTQRYLAAAQDASWSVPTLENLAVDDSIAGGYAAAEGMLTGTPWTPLDQQTPGMQRLTTTLTTYFPDDRVDLYAQTGWLGCLLVEHAMQLMGPTGISRARLVQTLEALHDWDTGLGPVVSYGPGHHVGDVESSLMAVRGAGSSDWRLVTVHGEVRLG